jgi:hypothetical protein
LLPIVFGCSASGRHAQIPPELDKALDEADELWLYSIHSEVNFSGLDEQPTLGKTKIEDRAVRKRLVEAFRKGVASIRQPAAKCFRPRHGIRLVKNGVNTDLLICFQCSNVYAVRNGEQMGNFAIARSPATVFDEVLTKAGIELAPKD